MVVSNPELLSRVMAEIGRKGGRIGGKRRLKTMTPEQRSEVASSAAKVRWAKARAKESGKEQHFTSDIT